MTKSTGVEADAVWDSSRGLAAEERKTGGRVKPAPEKRGGKLAPFRREIAGNASVMPAFIPPQLCKTLARPPSAGWLHEIKFDGYRVQMRIENGTVVFRRGILTPLAGEYLFNFDPC